MNTSMSMSIDEVLDKAADKLIIDGWQRGSAGERGGPNCAFGAIVHVVGYRFPPQTIYPYTPDYSAVRKVVKFVELTMFKDMRYSSAGFLGDDTKPTLTGWNDHIAKDADEVIELLRMAAKKYREQIQKEGGE